MEVAHRNFGRESLILLKIHFQFNVTWRTVCRLDFAGQRRLLFSSVREPKAAQRVRIKRKQERKNHSIISIIKYPTRGLLQQAKRLLYERAPNQQFPSSQQNPGPCFWPSPRINHAKRHFTLTHTCVCAPLPAFCPRRGNRNKAKYLVSVDF
jgi:hypothetical protein